MKCKECGNNMHQCYSQGEHLNNYHCSECGTYVECDLWFVPEYTRRRRLSKEKPTYYVIRNGCINVSTDNIDSIKDYIEECLKKQSLDEVLDSIKIIKGHTHTVAIEISTSIE